MTHTCDLDPKRIAVNRPENGSTRMRQERADKVVHPVTDLRGVPPEPRRPADGLNFAGALSYIEYWIRFWQTTITIGVFPKRKSDKSLKHELWVIKISELFVENPFLSDLAMLCRLDLRFSHNINMFNLT